MSRNKKIQYIVSLFSSIILLSSFLIPSFIQIANAFPDNPGGGNAGDGITSPISVLTIKDLITKIINWLLGLVGLLALLALIVGGLKIILGFANEKQVEEGKEIIKWAIIGLIVVMISYGIILAISVAIP